MNTLTNNDFTIAIDFKMLKFNKEPVTIISINCWALKLNSEAVLLWEKRMTEFVWVT